MTDKQKFKISGILKGMDTNSGEGAKGPWTRMAIKIEKEGKLITVSTFDNEDQTVALAANGKQVEVHYTKSFKGEIEYKNMVKGSLTVIGDVPTEGEPLGDIKEETIGEAPIKEESIKNEPAMPPYIVDTQRLIVRQSSWDKANKYIENLLKAVELKIEGVKIDKKDLTITSMEALAHKIEDDVMRK